MKRTKRLAACSIALPGALGALDAHGGAIGYIDAADIDGSVKAAPRLD